MRLNVKYELKKKVKNYIIFQFEIVSYFDHSMVAGWYIIYI